MTLPATPDAFDAPVTEGATTLASGPLLEALSPITVPVASDNKPGHDHGQKKEPGWDMDPPGTLAIAATPTQLQRDGITLQPLAERYQSRCADGGDALSRDG